MMEIITMNMTRAYAEYATAEAVKLLNIDSPTGYTAQAAAWVKSAFEELGFVATLTRKGGVVIDLGGEDDADGLWLEAHADTLGGMVAEIKGDGRLRLTNLGGMRAENGECENVRVHTRNGRIIEGTLQLCNASVHVNGGYGSAARTFDTTEVVLDENVNSADDTRALGIEVGDIVAFDPRTRVTDSGYIKSRFLDDKIGVAILLAFSKYVAENKIQLKRKVYVGFTVYEEVLHAGGTAIPEDVVELLGVDMGCVGEGLEGSETRVSIVARDNYGPYNNAMVTELTKLAIDNGV
ncbi:MAG: peptidase M42, partial [Clostridia bacterium]|nr:peptidase M42 [Clostridia bacterium]